MYKTALTRQKRNKRIYKKISTNLSKFDFKEISFKFVGIILIITLSVGYLNIPVTNAYYNDTESSVGNNWTAGALDFVLTDSGFSSVSAALNFEFGTATSKTVGMALINESNPIKYTASTKNISGDISFCNAINLSANLNNENQFSGSLTNFVSLATTTINNWQYDFSMPTDSHFYNSVCSFDFEYNGRQTLPHNEYSNSGYYDIEKATSTLISWGFRINKVYYDVDTTKRGLDSNNEWVEIYNQTDVSLDISNWQICDNDSCDIIPASTTLIPAKGFGVITSSSTTWQYWDMPSDVVKIELGSNIGNGLANGGDRLILKRPDGVIIDQMNWKNDTGVWNPGALDVGDGHMLGRKPNGYDMDQSTDFVDFAPPILSLISPDQSGSITWYWTYNYDITWLATNPNGSDNDLKIGLSYIRDTDGSTTITPSDEDVIIAEDLPNTGLYNWIVPSGFVGYIWIKIIALGPENPMLNAQMTSGKIWDPYPIELVLTDPEIVLESLLNLAESVFATSMATTTEEIVEIEPMASTTQIILGGSSETFVAEEIVISATSTVELATSTLKVATSTDLTDLPPVAPEEIVTETASSTNEATQEVTEVIEETKETEIVEEIVTEPAIEPEIIVEPIPIIESAVITE